MTLIERRKVNGFTVEISYDPDASSPRDDDPGTEMVLYHRQYTFPNDAGIDLDLYGGWTEIADVLTRCGALYILPVYMLDHSGVALSVRDFGDPWDSGQAGVAYVTRDIWKDTQGAEWTGSDEDRAQAAAMIKADVELYGSYVNGECYWYRVLDWDGEEMEASHGFIGWEHAEAAATEAAEGLTHEPKCTGTLDRRTGTITHDRECPVHQ